MFYRIDIDDKTSDLDLDHETEVYGDNDAWEGSVTPEQEQEALWEPATD